MELGPEFDFNLTKIIRYLRAIQPGYDKPFIKESRYRTLLRNTDNYYKIYKQNSKIEDYASWYYEVSSIGYSYSHKICDLLKHNYDDLVTISEAYGEPIGQHVRLGGMVYDCRRIISRAKNEMKLFTLEDGSGRSMRLTLMGKNFARNDALNNYRQIIDGDIVICEGQFKGETVFIDTIVRQPIEIYTKLSDLKKDKKENDKKSEDTTLSESG
jgi:DNA polymerase III alpha subunit